MSMDALRAWFERALGSRLDERGLAWFHATREEIARGLSDVEFAGRISLASRYAKKGPLGSTKEERRSAAELVAGWSPQAWTLLDALRVALVLARNDLPEDSAVKALEECFRYADVGELVALYRALPLLPNRERFAWRAGEGCRSNMKAVFQAVACDNPLPAEVFDDIAWRQMVIKAVFVEAPLRDVRGLEARRSEELARMALDLADERRSAGRPVQPDLWMCLGLYGGERARASLERELTDPLGPSRGRVNAAYVLARQGYKARVNQFIDAERDDLVQFELMNAVARAEVKEEIDFWCSFD